MESASSQVVCLYARGVFMLPPQPPRHHVHDHMQEYDFDADGIDADERVALQRTYVVQKIGLGAGAVMQAALTYAGTNVHGLKRCGTRG